MRNKGSATVEACIAVPLFLFFMLTMWSIGMLLLAEAHIHQSLAEAANDMALYCYLEDRLMPESGKSVERLIDTVKLWEQFDHYLKDDFYVERMVFNGKKGIVLTVSMDPEHPKMFFAEAFYTAKISVPVIGTFDLPITCKIKKKAFLGYDRKEGGEEEQYVYVTPNESVYHLSRNCTHLALQVEQKNAGARSYYTPCSFCGNSRNEAGTVYVARTSEIYHNRRDCSGLKRTVSRVKRSETGGLGPCSRCGR